MPVKATFYDCPEGCNQYNSTYLWYDLKSRNALASNETTNVTILIDVNKIQDDRQIYFDAWVSSSDKETNTDDNFVVVSMNMTELSKIEIIG